MKLANIIQAFERERDRGNELEAIIINPADYHDVRKDAYKHYPFLKQTNDLVFHYSDVPIHQTNYIQTGTILTIHKKKKMKPTLIVGGPASGKTTLGEILYNVSEQYTRLKTPFAFLHLTNISNCKTIIVEECLLEQVKEFVSRVDFDDSINWIFIVQDYTGDETGNRRFNVIRLWHSRNIKK